MKKVFISLLLIFSLSGCGGFKGFFIGADAGKRYEDTAKAAAAMAKPETKKEKLSKNLNAFNYLFILTAAAGIGVLGFGLWIQAATRTGKSFIVTGAGLLALSLCGPVALYILEQVAVIIGWLCVALSVLAFLYFVYRLVLYIKQEHQTTDQLIRGQASTLNLLPEKEQGKALLHAVQDNLTKDIVKHRLEKLGLKNKGQNHGS